MGLRGHNSGSSLKLLKDKLYSLGFPSWTFVLFTILHFSLEGPTQSSAHCDFISF